MKRLMNIVDLQDIQFENEVNHLMMLAHRHIVRLVGYCYEIQVREHRGRHIQAATAEKVLCYEYMPNGSLDNMIYGMLYYNAKCNNNISPLTSFSI